MSLSDKLNPALNTLPVYQPGRPIEEVARELGLERDEVIKVASNENPLGPSPLAVEAMKTAIGQSHLYPDGNAFYLKNNWRPNWTSSRGTSSSVTAQTRSSSSCRTCCLVPATR